MGKSLLTYPLICAAVNLLSLSANKISVRDLSNLLNSPYIRVSGGARLDEKLRKFSTMDILVPMTMKNAAKCDTQCELQNSLNHQIFERNPHQTCLHVLVCLFQYLEYQKSQYD